jgi:gluconate kinase
MKPRRTALRRARHRAHEVFDRLWQERYMARKDAYRWLQRITGLSDDEAHFRCFDVGMCEAVEQEARQRLRDFQRRLRA